MSPRTSPLRALALRLPHQEIEQQLAAVARTVGLGVATLQSADRRADIAHRRAIAAWILVDRLHWPQFMVAQSFTRTERAIKKMLRAQRARTATHQKP